MMSSSRIGQQRKLAKQNLNVYNLYYFFYYFGLGVFLPLFPYYMKQVAQLGSDQIGVILSFGPLISMIFQPIWGILNDKLHLNKKIVYLGIFMMDLAVVIIMIQHAFSIIVIAMVIFSLFSCAIGPLQDSFSIMFVRKYGFKYGDIRIWGSIGYMVSSLFTGYLVELLNGYDIIIYLSSIANLIALITFIRIKQIRIKREPIVHKKQSNLKIVLRNRVFIIFLLFTAFSIGMIFAIGSFLTLKIDALGGSTTQVGVVTALQVLMEIIAMFYVIKLNKGITDFKLLIISILIQIPVLLVYIFSQQLNAVLYILLLRGISSGLFLPVIINILSSLLPSEQISAGITLYSALSINLPGYIMTLTAGYIAKWFNYETLFSVTLIFLVLSLLFGYLLHRARKLVVTHF